LGLGDLRLVLLGVELQLDDRGTDRGTAEGRAEHPAEGIGHYRLTPATSPPLSSRTAAEVAARAAISAATAAISRSRRSCFARCVTRSHSCRLATPAAHDHGSSRRRAPSSCEEHHSTPVLDMREPAAPRKPRARTAE